MEFDKRGVFITPADKANSGVTELDTEYSVRAKVDAYRDQQIEASARASASNPEGYSEWNNFWQTVTLGKVTVLAILLIILFSLPFIMKLVMGK
jgi:hypothetical protein